MAQKTGATIVDVCLTEATQEIDLEDLQAKLRPGKTKVKRLARGGACRGAGGVPSGYAGLGQGPAGAQARLEAAGGTPQQQLQADRHSREHPTGSNCMLCVLSFPACAGTN